MPFGWQQSSICQITLYCICDICSNFYGANVLLLFILIEYWWLILVPRLSTQRDQIFWTTLTMPSPSLCLWWERSCYYLCWSQLGPLFTKTAVDYFFRGNSFSIVEWVKWEYCLKKFSARVTTHTLHCIAYCIAYSILITF